MFQELTLISFAIDSEVKDRFLITLFMKKKMHSQKVFDDK